MLKPNVDIQEFKKYGFKQCREIPKDTPCLYLCIKKDSTMIFVSECVYIIDKWRHNDPRIHKQANCTRADDNRDAMDITFDLIQAGMLKKEN